MASQNIVILNKDNFDQEVLQSPIPVVVDFWAEWCGPCKMFAPTFEQVADEYAGRVKFAKLDIDANQDLAMKYDIRSVPTLLFFKGGQVTGQSIGAKQRAELKALVDQTLS